MKNGDWFGLVMLGVLGLIVINKIAMSPACGSNCQVLLSDARGTLVQDVITGLQYWV
jgi:hypothetical protein